MDKQIKDNLFANSKFQKIITYSSLLVIIIFSIFLRYEDFSEWKKTKTNFQYQNEYQMANFDSYYYLRIAKDLKNNNYNSIDDKRRVPDGVKRSAIPPLLPWLTTLINKVTNIQLATIAIFMPVLLSSFLIILMFFVALRLKLHPIASLTVSIFSAISLTYVVRTRIGVFDTDSLNVVFPILNSYLLYSFIEIKDKKRYKYLIFTFISTFLYFIWWNTATSVVIFSLLIPLFFIIVFFYKSEKPIRDYAIFTIISLTSLFLIKDQIFSYFKLVFNSTKSSFPNNMDIGELDSVTILSFIEKTINNKFIIFLMLIGFIYFIIKNRLKVLIFIVPILLAISPFFAGNRFIIFSAPIMALSMGYFIQILFNFKNDIKIAFVITSLIISLGIYTNYEIITKGIQKPAAFDNMKILDVLKENVPKDSNVWSDSDIGYQVQYYLNMGTYADGEFDSGEIYYYLYFPLAANNLALTANYMQFYNVHGKKGMLKLYTMFSTIDETFTFLKNVLSLKPESAKLLLDKKIKNKKLSLNKFKNTDEWLTFLYPKQNKDIYLFIHYRMTQTVAWFKQGGADLKTGKTKGLPLFLIFYGLREKNGIIGNQQIMINTINGRAMMSNGAKQSFQYILSYNRADSKKYNFTKNGEHVDWEMSKNDKRFAFHWNQNIGLGVALSKEIGNTTLAKLFVQNYGANYFEPIKLGTPMFQIWKVHGDKYQK